MTGPADDDAGPPPLVTVEGLDHIVLNVADVERSLRFYCGLLGLEPVRLEEWRRGTVPFPSARIDGSTIIDLVAEERTGENVDHFCLVVTPTDFEVLCDEGRLDVIDGPAPRFGAQGYGTSLYVRDPDANVVELRFYDT